MACPHSVVSCFQVHTEYSIKLAILFKEPGKEGNSCWGRIENRAYETETETGNGNGNGN